MTEYQPPDAERPDDAIIRDLEERLASVRSDPRPAWRGAVRRELTETAARLRITPRPDRLTQVVTLYAVAGFILLVLVFLGLIGAGPFAAG
jgi:hypothetical protein